MGGRTPAWSNCAASEFLDRGVHFTNVNMPLVRTAMTAPTKFYANVPTLDPDEAADLIIDAIIHRPARVATRLGRFGQVMHALLPNFAHIVMNTAFRMFPDTAGKDGAPLKRETVYAQWLREHLAVREGTPPQPWQGAVELLDVQLSAFARSKSVRRTQASADQGRKGHASDGPDATLKGRLRITDPTAFAHLVARGVGRHRAFGFGMLLLHRAT